MVEITEIIFLVFLDGCCWDTLFYDDFNLNEIVNKFRGFQRLDAEASLVLYVSCKDEGMCNIHVDL